jgi:hypothetical protein
VFSRAARLLTDEGRRGPTPYTVEIVARSRGTLVTSSGIGLVRTPILGGELLPRTWHLHACSLISTMEGSPAAGGFASAWFGLYKAR